MIQFIKKSLAISILLFLLFLQPGVSKAQLSNDPCGFIKNVYNNSPVQSRLVALCSNRLNIINSQPNSADERNKNLVLVSMLDRQMDAAESYLDLAQRVDKLNIKDSRKKTARDTLADTEKVILDFASLNVQSSTDLLSLDPYAPSSVFNEKDKEAKSSLIKVNQILLTPNRPGTSTNSSGEEMGGVPEGDLIDDFVPGVIRLLFRFTSLIIFISFLVSGVMYITAFGNEDSLNKARRILYFSLIGFAIVTLAFAIVQAVTDIDFFGFI